MYWNKYIDKNGVKFLSKDYRSYSHYGGWLRCNFYNVYTDPQFKTNKGHFIILNHKLARLFYL